MKSTRLRIIQKYHPTQLWRAAQRSTLASFILLTLVCSFAVPLAKPHLTINQVRPEISAPHLNGVQVVAGSNPAAPTIPLYCDFHPEVTPTKIPLLKYQPSATFFGDFPLLTALLLVGTTLLPIVAGIAGNGEDHDGGSRATKTRAAITYILQPHTGNVTSPRLKCRRPSPFSSPSLLIRGGN
ncbi:hypothetical protein ES703_25184 [subsurface metagenome]